MKVAAVLLLAISFGVAQGVVQLTEDGGPVSENMGQLFKAAKIDPEKNNYSDEDLNHLAANHFLQTSEGVSAVSFQSEYLGAAENQPPSSLGRPTCSDPNFYFQWTKVLSGNYDSSEGRLQRQGETRSFKIGEVSYAFKNLANIESEEDGFVQVLADTERKAIVISFRGTDSAVDFWNNLFFSLKPFNFVPDCGMVHGEWLKHYGSLRSQILTTVRRLPRFFEYDFFFLGHSLGGALASMALADISRALVIPRAKTHLYVFGTPKPGNLQFRVCAARYTFDSVMWVNRWTTRTCFGGLAGADMVVSLPPSDSFATPTINSCSVPCEHSCSTACCDATKFGLGIKCHFLTSYMASFRNLIFPEAVSK